MRSALLSGGNTDGVSGPGVGSVTISVHEGGVGIIMLGVEDETVVGDAGVVLPQEEARKERVKERKKNEENLLMFDIVCNLFHSHYLTVCCSSSKDVIQAMVLMNSLSD